MSEDTEEFPNQPKQSYPGLDDFFQANEEWAEAYDPLVDYVVRQDNALSKKNKELIITAFCASDGRVDACRNHIESAYEHGASVPEIHQTIQLAAHIGGALSMVTGAKALDQLDLEDD